jgi:hypothetical protein
MSALTDYNAKLRQLSESIRLKIAGKLGKTEQAADSAKLGGKSLTDLYAIFNIKDYQVASEYITVAADGVKQYDLQTLMTAAVFATFDIKTVEILVRAKDTTASSPLFNAYANAEALVTYGIKDERYVIIANQSGASIDLYVKIRVQPK